jgi:hypothetical protein
MAALAFCAELDTFSRSALPLNVAVRMKATRHSRGTPSAVSITIQLQYVRPRRNPQMQRDFLTGCDDADALGSTPEREAVTLSKLGDIGNVFVIGDQTRKTVQRQYDLLMR